MEKSSIPIVDLSSFFREGDEDGKQKAKELIGRACKEHGFFQLVNHGVSQELMTRSLDLSKSFFEFPNEEKLKYSCKTALGIAVGYFHGREARVDKNEHFLILAPELGLNVYPDNPPEAKRVLEDIWASFTKLSLIIQDIINELLGLPPNFLRQFNDNRSFDVLTALHYFPDDGTDSGAGKSAHQDGNCITFVLQDEVEGLEVHQNGQWIPIVPAPGTLVVNIGDLLQVLTNNRFKSATHRVVRPKGRSRYSYAFFYNLHGEKRVEPLPHFTKEIGEPPKYRGFVYKEYLQLRSQNRFKPPSNPEDMFNITHYEIPQK